MAGPSTQPLPRPPSYKIRCTGVARFFPARHGRVAALAGIDLDVAPGEFLAVVGPSGCGKTTLLRIIAGLDRQSGGQVEVRREHPNKPLNAMVFQEHSIFPWMTVRENVAFGLRVRGVPARERAEIADRFIAKTGLSRFADAFPHQLSGGMKQRVSIARAFATDPEVLLMDEPFAALDEQNRNLLHEELLRIWSETNKTVVFITHSIDEAVVLSDRVVVMTASPGAIKAEIPVPFPRPRDPMAVRGDPRYGQLVTRIWSSMRDEVLKAKEREVQGG